MGEPNYDGPELARTSDVERSFRQDPSSPARCPLSGV